MKRKTLMITTAFFALLLLLPFFSLGFKYVQDPYYSWELYFAFIDFIIVCELIKKFE